MNIEQTFKAAIFEKLGSAPNDVVADGNIHRFATSKRGGDDAGYYVLHDDGLPAGSFGDWRAGTKFKWSGKAASSLTTEEKARLEELKATRARREAEAYAKAAQAADRRFANAKAASPDHPYLKNKRVGAHGIREAHGTLLVPVYDDNELISLQSIGADGGKLFTKGSRTAGGYFVLGEVDGGVIVIAEGYATAATILEDTGLPSCVAFNAGNLVAVAKTMRALYPAAKIIVAADDDYRTEAERGFNPGKREAEKAAAAVGGVVILTSFDRARGDEGTDFNDLKLARGADAVREAFVKMSEPDNSGEIARLAALAPIDYDKQRDGAAERLGCRVSTLDSEVKKHREAAQHTKEAVGLCTDIDPCAEAVDVATLLNEIRSTIGRFIICDSSTATAATLWIAFTWIVDHAQVAPLAIITAPEKGCGKTQFLDVIGRLSRRPLFASNISPAATFRVIEAKTPTLLIDEADAFFRENEELRGVINSGHTRTSAYVIRTVGDDFEVKQFSTWGAKAIAGIGRLPETVMSRGIVLTLRRKLKTEKVERLRHTSPALFEALASRLARFSADHAPVIGRARPAIPDSLGDREQDNWEPLIAIADHAGGVWPTEARRAAISICGADAGAASTAEELLTDIREIFESERVTRISMVELLRLLVTDETAPWATWNRGRPISPRQLSARLKEFGIHSMTVSLGQYEKPKGFKREQFEDAWARYLEAEHVSSPDTPLSPVTRSPSPVSGQEQVAELVTDATSVSHRRARSPDDSKVTEAKVTQVGNLRSPVGSPINPRVSGQGDRVTDQSPISGERVIEI